MFPINTAVEVAGLTSSAPLNGLRGIVVAGALNNGRVPVMLAGRNQPIAIKPANLRLADAWFVCADAHLHGFHFDKDPPLFEINCNCDDDRFMHLECAVGLGGTDVGNSWRRCPTCHGKYGDHTFAKAVAEEAWATFKDATGPPGSGTMIDIQRLQAMYALAAVKLKEGHFDEAARLLSQHVLACEQLAVADPLISSLSRILASKSKMDLGNVKGEQCKHTEAEALCREVLAFDQEQQGEGCYGALVGRNNIGMSLSAQGKLAEAETEFRDALEVSVAGSIHTPKLKGVTLPLRGNLALVLEKQKKYVEAEVMRRECLLETTHLCGPNHQSTRSATAGMCLRYATLRAGVVARALEPASPAQARGARRAVPACVCAPRTSAGRPTAQRLTACTPPHHPPPHRPGRFSHGAEEIRRGGSVLSRELRVEPQPQPHYSRNFHLLVQSHHRHHQPSGTRNRGGRNVPGGLRGRLRSLG